MGQFDRQIKTALKLIAKNGQAVKWRVVRNGEADPSTPWKPALPIEVVEYDVEMCFLPISRQIRESLVFMKGSDVSTSSVMGYMGAVEFAPSLKDVVIRDGQEYRIENIDYLAPNGQNILYTVIFKA